MNNIDIYKPELNEEFLEMKEKVFNLFERRKKLKNILSETENFIKTTEQEIISMQNKRAEMEISIQLNETSKPTISLTALIKKAEKDLAAAKIRKTVAEKEIIDNENVISEVYGYYINVTRTFYGELKEELNNKLSELVPAFVPILQLAYGIEKGTKNNDMLYQINKINLPCLSSYNSFINGDRINGQVISDNWEQNKEAKQWYDLLIETAKLNYDFTDIKDNIARRKSEEQQKRMLEDAKKPRIISC